MEFRPCIDIHNGKVKQIVGGSLKDEGNMADENFVSMQDAAFYAELYKKAGLKGGHVILLNGKDSPNYGVYEFKRGFGGFVVEYIGYRRIRKACRLAAALQLKMQKNFLQQEQVMSLSRLMYSVMERFRWID